MVKLEGRERAAPQNLGITSLADLVNSRISETSKVASWEFLSKSDFFFLEKEFISVDITCDHQVCMAYDMLQITVLFLMASKLPSGAR